MSYPNNNNALNSSKANIAKLFLLTFLGVQAVRQLIDVNTNAGAAKPTESLEGKVAAWFTITMTLAAAYFLYTPKIPHRSALLALFVATMGSGVAMIYNVMKNDVRPERNRLWFGIAHVIFALITLVYLLISNM